VASASVSHWFDAPPDVVFDVLTDARRYPDYTPIRRVAMEREGEGEANGVGAIRALHLAGSPVRELVTDHVRPGRFAFEVLSGGGVRAYEGTLTFEPAAGGTDVTYAIELEPLVPGTGFATAAAFRGAVEVLMRLADHEARRRVAGA
jgi:hypothetical protein